MSERRQQPRIRIQRQVIIFQKSGQHVKARGNDLSSGGISILCDHSAQVGQTLQIRFSLTDPRDSKLLPVEAKVEVRNWTLAAAENAYRMGLQFVDISDDHKSIVQDYLKSRGAVITSQDELHNLL